MHDTSAAVPVGTSTDFLLGRMDGKMDLLLSGQTEMKQALRDHEERIANLELSRAAQQGATKRQVFLASGMTGLVAALLPFLKGLLGL